MRRLFFLFALVLAGAAHAETYEIALPDLTGDFDSGFVAPDAGQHARSTTFSIPTTITSIDQLRLVVSGTAANGEYVCLRDVGGVTVADTLPAVPRMRLVLAAQSLGGDCFFGDVNLTGSPFSDATGTLAPCAPGSTLDPNLLLGVAVQAELSCSYLTDCEPSADALATIDDVRLAIDGQGVAVADRAWGVIKALYR